jgi:hypothetical protein
MVVSSYCCAAARYWIGLRTHSHVTALERLDFAFSLQLAQLLYGLVTRIYEAKFSAWPESAYGEHSYSTVLVLFTHKPPCACCCFPELRRNAPRGSPRG